MCNIEEEAERLEWTNHIYCYTPMHSAGVIDEIKEFSKTKLNFFDTFMQTMVDKKNAAKEDKDAITSIQANMTVEFYEYLRTVPLMMHLYPVDFIQMTHKFIHQFEEQLQVDKETKDKVLHVLREFCTMYKYLDCLSWYNTNPAETPSDATLHHFTTLISNPDYYDMMFSEEKRESPIYHMVYDPKSKKVIKAVFHDGPYILEVPPQGFTFGEIKILYDEENVFIIKPPSFRD